MRNIEARRAWVNGRYRDPKPVPSGFEVLCKDLGLDPDGPAPLLTANQEVRYFVQQFAGKKYIPEDLVREVLRAKAKDSEQTPKGYPLRCPAPPPIYLGETNTEQDENTKEEAHEEQVGIRTQS